MYKPGDIVIEGVFSLHKSGLMPLSCGDFDMSIRSGIQYMEAMFYAINQVNTNIKATRGILRGVTLGGLAFDDCMDKSLGSHFVTEVARSARSITDQSGNMLDPNTVESYMAAHTSDLTFPIADLMDYIKRPLIGYAATSSDLNDKHYYRYMRLGNHYLLKALVLMVKRLGWNYIQVLQTAGMPGSYFDTLYNDLKNLATEEGVCIVARHMFPTDANDMDDVIQKLKAHESVKPVVFLATYDDIRSYLLKVQEMNAGGHFHYVLPMGLDAGSVFKGIEKCDGGDACS